MSNFYPGLSITHRKLPDFEIGLHKIYMPDRQLWGLNAIPTASDGELIESIAHGLEPRFLHSFYLKIVYEAFSKAAESSLLQNNAPLLVRLPSVLNPQQFDKIFARRMAAAVGLSPSQVFLRLTPASRISLSRISSLAQKPDLSGGCNSALDRDIAPVPSLTPSSLRLIKLDPTVAAGLDHHRVEQRLVAEFIRKSNTIGVRAVAEGVESEEQCRQLTQVGVSAMQGPLFSTELPTHRSDVA